MSLRRHHFRARSDLLLLGLSLATAALLLLAGVATAAASSATGGQAAQNPQPQGSGYYSVAYAPASSVQAPGSAESPQKSTTGPVSPASVRLAGGAMSGAQDHGAVDLPLALAGCRSGVRVVAACPRVVHGTCDDSPCAAETCDNGRGQNVDSAKEFCGIRRRRERRLIMASR